MESPVSLDHEASPQCDDVLIKDVITSETNLTASNQPVKKQTRQWAAWTRQEEELFFAGLRQAGKNFDKITSTVQSKNKDQVRHYYYRVVRRMNKLLGPRLSLDASNSKETNAALLQWWSLLEKQTCKASKIHLKPRRFKAFMGALEDHILKDRKKNTRKRPKLGGNSSTTPTIKPSRQRNKSGTSSRDAYKKWEKAAKAGVSLVADAAEHLERTALDKLADSVQDVHTKLPNDTRSTSGDNGLEPVAKSIPPVPRFHQNTKLKLQLFPVDESTRRALEMDNHNPHLELTLSTRKKIPSILEHMTRKWGNSSIASGELTLVPYSDQTSNVSDSHRWTRDSVLSAADVYAAIGSPAVFRLRYGWFNKTLSTLEWDDGLTNFSVSDLLTEVSQNADTNRVRSPPPSGLPCDRQISFSCDSFDAAIAAHINKHGGKNTFQPTVVSSIWDAEETCDAFSFPKKVHGIEENEPKDDCLAEEHLVDECQFDGNRMDGYTKEVQSIEENEPKDYYLAEEHLVDECQFDRNHMDGSTKEVQSIEENEPKEYYLAEEHLVDECQFDGNHMDGSTKDINLLTDIYWSDSLGPLDLDVGSCRYNDDVILGDSLGGLNCLINSSLDAFQNSSFFGSENRETPLATAGAQETASSSDNKAGN